MLALLLCTVTAVVVLFVLTYGLMLLFGSVFLNCWGC